jgi:hypothetical protein
VSRLELQAQSELDHARGVRLSHATEPAISKLRFYLIEREMVKGVKKLSPQL